MSPTDFFELGRGLAKVWIIEQSKKINPVENLLYLYFTNPVTENMQWWFAALFAAMRSR